jgi:carotenoid cleavage dioxygenase
MTLKSTIFSLVFYLLGVLLTPIDLLLDILQAYYATGKFKFPGNYAPVSKECTAYRIAVTSGAIPRDLVGEFIRNGPNPAFIPKGGHILIDGHGMLHGIRLTGDGTISYFNRYIKTAVYNEEIKAGRPLRIRLGEMKGKLGLLKIIVNQLKIVSGILPHLGGTANTSVVFHHQTLQALVEVDVPYAIRVLYDGQLETEARLDYGGKITNMTAHPKIDGLTQEMFFFGYANLEAPWLTYGYINSSGNVVRTMKIDIPRPVMMHDFAITEHYAIFLDLPLVFDKKKILAGKIYSFNPSFGARVGILDRYARNAEEIIWFNIPPCYVLHTVNAWEEGDEIILFACASPKFDVDVITDNFLTLVEWRFNMKTKQFQEQKLFPDLFTEFPTHHPALCGKKTKYVYLAIANPQQIDPLAHLCGIMKVDLQTKQTQKFMYGHNRTGGEASFVPRENMTSEDDGYLLTFVHDSAANQSSFWVIDAKSMTEIAIVNLPQRVPQGFHGIFMSEEDIKSQRVK